MVDEIFEICRGIGKAKGHYQRVKQSIPGSESYLPFSSLYHSNKVARSVNILLGEQFGFSKVQSGFVQEWWGVSVVNSSFM
jgi:hypothetical protein